VVNTSVVVKDLRLEGEDKDKESSFKNEDMDKDLKSKDEDKDENSKIGPRGSLKTRAFLEDNNTTSHDAHRRPLGVPCRKMT